MHNIPERELTEPVIGAHENVSYQTAKIFSAYAEGKQLNEGELEYLTSSRQLLETLSYVLGDRNVENPDVDAIRQFGRLEVRVKIALDVALSTVHASDKVSRVHEYRTLVDELKDSKHVAPEKAREIGNFFAAYSKSLTW